MFGFGGDAMRKAEWTVKLPVYVDGQSGVIECFLVDGATPLLVGRPILKSLKVKVDWDKDLISYGDQAWKPAIKGDRGEYLLRLDDGVQGDPEGRNLAFDLVTTETFEMVQRTGTMHSSTYTLLQYLEATGRDPPEHCLQVDGEPFQDNLTDDDEPVMNQQPQGQNDEQVAEVRKEITDKLLRGIRFHHATMFAHRRSVLEQGLRAHEEGAKVFWEVYSGEAGLSLEMQRRGYLVYSFDTNTGWNFDLPEHRNAYYKFLEDVAPDFVWLAPACKKWSKMQALNALTPEQEFALRCEQDYEEAVHLKLAERTFVIQYNEGRDGAIEHPAGSKAWSTKTWSNLPGWPCQLDQCAYETKIADQYVKKPTRLQLTSASMADYLAWRCPGDHERLPLEGSLPGIGSLTKAAGAYQTTFCYHIGAAIDCLFYEPEEFALEGGEWEIEDMGEYTPSVAGTEQREPDEPNHEPAPPADSEVRVQSYKATGVLQRLQRQDRQLAKRTVSRLHRNLGHPTNAELKRLLEMKGASSVLVECAQEHDCDVCRQHQHRPQVPVSSVPSVQEFNARVQADTLWIKIPSMKKALPILMISDTATRFLAGRVIWKESPEEFILAVERAWVRVFGPMQTLQVDDHRSWASDYVKSWCSEQGVELRISPGQSHTRLAILERRHQVTRRALELYLADQEQGNVLQPVEPREKLIQALRYVVPQINRSTNVRGYSPVQWVLGYTPHIPGLLTEEPLPPPSLDPSDEFLQKLQRQKAAANAVFSADVDTRLRRAMNRKFAGQLIVFHLGDMRYYYRDGPGGIGPKLRWRGPARIVMVEQLDGGPHSNIYWIVHGTNLLRTAPHNLRPLPVEDSGKAADDDPFKAQQSLQNIRSGGTTLYTDLTKTNKRQRHEVSSDEEDEEFDGDHMAGGEEGEVNPGLADYWQVSDDQKTWTRVHNVERKELFVPVSTDDVPVDRFRNQRLTVIRRNPPHPEHLRLRDDWRTIDAGRNLHYRWTGTTTFQIDDDVETASDDTFEQLVRDEPEEPPEPEDGSPEDDQPRTSASAMPSPAPPATNAPADDAPQEVQNNNEANEAPTEEPAPPSNEAAPQEMPPAPVPEHQKRLYEPTVNESFRNQRSRVDKQETLSFLKKPTVYGPMKSETARSTPYDQVATEDMNMQIEVDVQKIDDLPPGWHLENGWLCLDSPEDEWVMEGN